MNRFEIFRRATAIVFLGSGFPFLMNTGAEDDAGLAALRADAKKSFEANVAPFVKTYCFECHCNRRSKNGLNFEPALKNPGDSASSKKWIRAAANVKAHDMPPLKSDQPEEEERARFLASLGKLKYLSDKDPGPFVIRRLTRMEYGNTLRDLLGADPAVARDLPEEVPGEGYLNSLSPMQAEQYLGIASAALQQMTAKAERRLLGPEPAAGTDPQVRVREAAHSLARAAFRRPPSEAELDTLTAVFDLGRKSKLNEKEALRLMIKAALVSPQFLFITPAREAEKGQAIVPLDDHQLASRLSYFLWATMPDAELSALADAGKLADPAILRQQAHRLLADPRSLALFDGFGRQWLGLNNLEQKTFDPAKFPQMNPELRTAMIEEARLFFENMVRTNQSVVRFVDSDETFLNATLAPFYGMEKEIAGPEMRLVKLRDRHRGGILAMPATLAATSFPDRASAVKRGAWVLEQVLGEQVPPAPANVPALEKQDPKAVAHLTLRQRTELHRSNAVCANCHQILDPIGFGLENFDAIGRWRDRDESGLPVDAAGQLPGGRSFSSPGELKSLIAERREDLVRNLTEKLLAYALCRPLEGYDYVVTDAIMKNVAGDESRMQSLVTEIIASYSFTHRRIRD